MKHKRSIMSIAMATLVLVSLCAVCASTSVIAAPSSSANAETSAGLVGAPAGVVGAPAVCSQATNSLDLFVRGTDNALYWRHWTSATAWGLWMYLGGYLTSDPGATSDDGGLAVFVRGGDGALWSRTMVNSGSSWSQWTSQGGQLLKGTGPAAAFFRDVWHGVFVTGTNHQLYYYNAASKVWQSLGGYLTSSPTATIFDCDPACGCEVSARGGDGALWSIHYYPSSWSNWYKIGGQLLEGTGPAICTYYAYYWPGHLVTGTDHALWWWTNKGGWTSLGGYLTSSPAAAVHSMNVVDVFARGGDGNIWSRHTVNGGTSWDLWYKVAE